MNYPYKKGWWETKDHRKLKIEDMETSHIENTIKYLKKNIDFYDEGEVRPLSKRIELS